MPTIETLTLFAGVALFFAAVPGPNFIFVLTTSLSQGPGRGQLAVLGVVSGALIHISLAVWGLTVLLQTSHLVFRVFQIAGALFLIYIGLTMLRHSRQGIMEPRWSPQHTYRNGFVTTLLNPKAAIYYFAFLPQFIDPGLGHIQWQFIVLGGIQMTAAFTVYTIVAQVAGVARRFIVRYQGWIRPLSGIVYIGLGIWVALANEGI
ncbi:MAG: LysE family translocator [Ardenticatenaceae bacterium]|nr:LysE family translocator [Ardenticatenaceae bacterium]MCB9443222.1 LysE family translocator [Ardenticatenaceae bacterium]